MHKLLASVLFLAWSAQASAYTIDFEEFDVGYVGPTLISGDYVITNDYSCDSSQAPLCGAEITDAKSLRIYGEPNFFAVYAWAEVERSDGGAFAVLSADVINDFGGGAIFGTTSSGDNIYGVLADLGQGQWLDVTRFGYEVYYPEATPVPAIVEIDNILVSAVPVPAAVWLFGSALAGLALVRRRKT